MGELCLFNKELLLSIKYKKQILNTLTIFQKKYLNINYKYHYQCILASPWVFLNLFCASLNSILSPEALNLFNPTYL
jgi:hypothetical protein